MAHRDFKAAKLGVVAVCSCSVRQATKMIRNLSNHSSSYIDPKEPFIHDTWHYVCVCTCQYLEVRSYQWSMHRDQ